VSFCFERARSGGGLLQTLDLRQTIPWQLRTSDGSGSVSTDELEKGH